MSYALASAAPTAAIWQSLFNLYVELGTVAGVVVIAWLMYYLVKYRARSSMAAKVEAKDGVLNVLYKFRDQKVTRFIGMTSHTNPTVLKTAKIGRAHV